MRRSDPERLTPLARASSYLDGLVNRERSGDYVYTRLDLCPIEALLDAIGRPHERLSVVHVAGSKGKGSTCLYTEALLGALGERVGTFTSPHLESWIERFRIGGREVEPAQLVAAVERIRPALDALRDGPLETRPSFFDATAAIAFTLFAEAGVDRAVIEVGLGGRLDSTNVVWPAVTCITSIELEHTDKLGTTEAAIAGEKAGILKPGVPAVLGALGREADEVIRSRALQLAAPVSARGQHFDVQVERAWGYALRCVRSFPEHSLRVEGLGSDPRGARVARVGGRLECGSRARLREGARRPLRSGGARGCHQGSRPRGPARAHRDPAK